MTLTQLLALNIVLLHLVLDTPFNKQERLLLSKVDLVGYPIFVFSVMALFKIARDPNEHRTRQTAKAILITMFTGAEEV